MTILFNHALTRLPSLLKLCLAASLASLAVVYIAQYRFDLQPCHLCIAQRIPFALVAVLALAGLLKPRLGLPFLYAISALFLIGSGIAFYHSAVERHWVSGPSGCTIGDVPAGQSDDDFLKRIQNAPVVACDQPAWQWHGITMALMNVLWSLFLCFFLLIGLRADRRKAHA